MDRLRLLLMGLQPVEHADARALEMLGFDVEQCPGNVGAHFAN